MKINLKLSVIAVGVSLSLSGQTLINGRGCSTVLPPPEWDAAFNKQVEEYKQNLATGKSQMASYTIPVIMHVIYGTQAVGAYPNISQLQLNSQINVMNADFGGTGFNVSNLAGTSFSTVGAANCNITFCLAQLDPSGNPLAEPGIDRVSYTTLSTTVNPTSFTSQNSFQAYIDNTVKPQTIWDPTKYYNIWVTDINQSIGLLGYATFPSLSTLPGLSGNMSSAVNDGIWVYAKAFGNTGSLQSPYNKGRTASHETGHYLGLRHIGGDGQANGTGSQNANGDCSATDYCTDTPPQKGGYSGGQYGQNYGSPPIAAPLHASVCVTSGDMFMNIMDYTDDAACYMFTPDQRSRIQTALAHSPFRSSLTASSATLCNIAAVLPTAGFEFVAPACTDILNQTENQSSGFPSPTFSWSASPSSGVTFSPSASSPSPSIIFASSGTYSIMMVAMNSAGTTTALNSVAVNTCQTGISTNSALYNHINLAPNPSSGIVNVITSLSASQDITILIHNALGQLVLDNHYSHVTTGTFKLDLEAYQAGIYSVTIVGSSEKAVKRLVLTK